MRRHRVPIGWPRYGPRHYRFPLPNALWEYRLKPVEFTILSYLYCCHSRSLDGEAVSVETVAEAVHLTVSTVKKHLVILISNKE